MIQRYISIILDKNMEFDFEVSSMIENLSIEDYNKLKSMLITAIGTMEIMRRNSKNIVGQKSLEKLLKVSEELDRE